MAKKESPEEHENHERWLVSYADFITLLFAFFVVLYASAQVDQRNQLAVFAIAQYQVMLEIEAGDVVDD